MSYRVLAKITCARQKLSKSVILLYFCYFSFVKAHIAKVLDLSHEMNSDTIYWPNGTPFQLFIQHRGLINSTLEEGEDNFWYEANDFKTAEHSGTHLDAPVHFGRNQWSVDQIPPDRFIGKVAVVDLRDIVKDNADYQITKDDLLKWETLNRRHLDPLVILWTGWAMHWPRKGKYLGTETNDISLLHFPGLHPATAEWLVNNRQIYGVGIDTASVDYGQSSNFLTHRTLAKHNVFFIENLDTRNLDIDGFRDLMLVVNPLKITSGSGSPVRPILLFGKLADYFSTHSGDSVQSKSDL